MPYWLHWSAANTLSKNITYGSLIPNPASIFTITSKFCSVAKFAFFFYRLSQFQNFRNFFPPFLFSSEKKSLFLKKYGSKFVITRINHAYFENRKNVPPFLSIARFYILGSCIYGCLNDACSCDCYEGWEGTDCSTKTGKFVFFTSLMSRRSRFEKISLVTL